MDRGLGTTWRFSGVTTWLTAQVPPRGTQGMMQCQEIDLVGLEQ